MAQKKVSASELAKINEQLAKINENVKKEKRISGSASGRMQPPNSNLMKSPVRRTGGIVGAGAAAINKLYRNMGN